MPNIELERKFTSMLIKTDTSAPYINLTSNYLCMDKNCMGLSLKEQKEKLASLREAKPREWITKIFSEGLDMPPKLYEVNILWLKYLEENGL